MTFTKGMAKTGGRKPGIANILGRNLREAAFAAAERAAGGTLEDYLYKQAVENPTAYLSFLARFIPQQLTDESDRPIIFTRVIREVIYPEERVIHAIEDRANGTDQAD